MRTIGVLAALALAAAAHAAELKIEADGMAAVDGARRFIVGMYEQFDDPAVFDAAAAAGFNLFRADAEAAQLDRIHAAGAYAWVNTGGAIELAEDAPARRAALEALVARAKDHPAMLVWEVPDEALWNVWYGAQQAREWNEPRQLAERVAALEDPERQERLRALLDTAARFRAQNNHRDAERAADEAWRLLGETPPHAGYGLSNAPEREAALCAAMLAGYEALRQRDPAHPVWMNHAPRNSIAQLARFGRAADIVGCDIYPVPAGNGVTGHSDLIDQTLSSVGAYTRRMQESAPAKPVWMVLQGFGWDDIAEKPGEGDAKRRRPTPGETRFMAFDAIVHGARGLLYWGTHAVEKESPFWKELLDFAAELKLLQPLLSAPDAGPRTTPPVEPTYGSLDRTIAVLPKQLPEGVWYIVVNESPYTLTYLLDTGDSPALAEWPASPLLEPRQGRLRHTIPGFSVQLLQPQTAP